MSVSVTLDDGDGYDYDRALEEVKHGIDVDVGVQIFTKCAGTHGNRPCVMIRFASADHPGECKTGHLVACYMTLREFLAAADVMRARHGGQL